MATDYASSTVAAGDDILASQYNNLRADSIRRSGDYETAGGSANAFTLAIDSSISAYVAGQVFVFKANHTITGAATLNVNGIGAKTIKKHTDNDLEAGDITNGQIVHVVYDGTDLQMTTPPAVGVHFENPGVTTEGSQETGDTTKTLTITTNFVPKTFEAIVIADIATGAIWTSGSNAGIGRQAFIVKGEVGGNITWQRVEAQHASSPPNSNPSLNPYGDEDASINKPTQGSGTTSSPGVGTITASGGSATFEVTSITATATTLVFTFTFTHNSENSGLRWGAHFVSVVGE